MISDLFGRLRWSKMSPKPKNRQQSCNRAVFFIYKNKKIGPVAFDAPRNSLLLAKIKKYVKILKKYAKTVYFPDTSQISVKNIAL